MTDYEKISLNLLSAIAQGMVQQVEMLRIMDLRQRGAEQADLDALAQKQMKSLGSWLQELMRLDQLARENHPDRFDSGNGRPSG